jgi:hypothetical protein
VSNLWRFVVLHHSGVQPEHFDLLIQVPGQEALLTWRVEAPLESWGNGTIAVRIADHRAIYMTYEGEISGGRGTVKRVAEGAVRVLHEDQHGWRARLEAEARETTGDKLNCEIHLLRGR